MNFKENQYIPVIIVGPSLVWDLTDAEEQSAGKDLLVEIAEAAIRLAEWAGADSDDVETLAMLLESVR